MPLHTPPRTLIELPVADRQVGDTLIRQKATFTNLTHSQDASGTCTARITVVVRLYAAEGEGFGPELVGPGFAPYSCELVADNNCLVEAATGNILAIRQQESEAAWLARCEAFKQDTLLQGDFFEQLRETQPVNIGQMIRAYIQQADAAGKFA